MGRGGWERRSTLSDSEEGKEEEGLEAPGGRGGGQLGETGQRYVGSNFLREILESLG